MHTRRWRGDLPVLRRAYGKLTDEDAKKTLLRVGLPELAQFCKESGWSDSELTLLDPQHSLPLVIHVGRFFEQSIRSIDLPKDGLMLPAEIVYHQVRTGAPACMPSSPAAQPVS